MYAWAAIFILYLVVQKNSKFERSCFYHPLKGESYHASCVGEMHAFVLIATPFLLPSMNETNWPFVNALSNESHRSG